MRITALFVLCSLLLLSCSTPQEVQETKTVTTKTADYSTLVVNSNEIRQKPKVADLVVATQRVKLTISYSGISVASAKELIKGEFMKQEKCDMIVEPYFSAITTSSADETVVKVTISAFPGFYKNIHNYTSADAIYFEK